MSAGSRRGGISMEARQYFTDSFQRANQSPVTFPPYRGVSAGAINLTSLRLQQQAAFKGASTPSTSADADITIVGNTVSSSSSLDALARMTAAGSNEGTDSVLFTVATSQWNLLEFVAGTATTIGHGALSLGSTAFSIRLVVAGTTVNAYINNSLIKTGTVTARAPGVWWHGLRGNGTAGSLFTNLTIVSNGLQASP